MLVFVLVPNYCGLIRWVIEGASVRIGIFLLTDFPEGEHLYWLFVSGLRFRRATPFKSWIPTPDLLSPIELMLISKLNECRATFRKAVYETPAPKPQVRASEWFHAPTVGNWDRFKKKCFVGNLLDIPSPLLYSYSLYPIPIMATNVRASIPEYHNV